MPSISFWVRWEPPPRPPGNRSADVGCAAIGQTDHCRSNSSNFTQIWRMKFNSEMPTATWRCGNRGALRIWSTRPPQVQIRSHEQSKQTFVWCVCVDTQIDPKKKNCEIVTFRARKHQASARSEVDRKNEIGAHRQLLLPVFFLLCYGWCALIPAKKDLAKFWP